MPEKDLVLKGFIGKTALPIVQYLCKHIQNFSAILTLNEAARESFRDFINTFTPPHLTDWREKNLKKAITGSLFFDLEALD